MGSATDQVRRGLRHLGGRRRDAARPGTGADPPRLPERPLLSVVVPTFQVEDYLAECLDSLLQQTYEHLEIVVVDDGSTDRSAAIARGYAARDTRITLVHQANAGLGAARNAGMDHSSGDLLTFADSDDTVPPQAYQKMVAALRRSGSDFVVGPLVRTEGGVERMRPWARRAHASRRLAVTIDDAPTLLNNVVACTKVFRRDFVDRIGLRFPEGTRYEDQVPITRAYLLARRFDVLPDVVYRWRKRDDKTSITQQKAEMADLVDRLAAQRACADFLHEHASDLVLRTWYTKSFRQDFFAYLRVAADADDEYWGHLQDSIVSIARQAPDDLDDEVELRIRLAVWLGRHGHREALRALLRDEGFPGSNFPVGTRPDGRLVARVPALEGLGIDVDADLLRVRDVDLTLVTRLEGLDWSMPGVLSVRCVAALSFVDPARRRVDTCVRLAGPGGTPDVEVAARAEPDEVGNIVARRAHEDHSGSVVVADVDLGALVRAAGDRPVSRWEVRVRTAADGMVAESPLERRREDGSAVAARSVLVDGALVTTSWEERTGLAVEVRRSHVAVTRVAVDDGGFRLDLHAPALGPVTRVHVGPHRVPATVVPAAGADRWEVRFGVPRTGTGPATGRLRVSGLTPDQRTVTVVADLQPGAVRLDGVVLVSTADGLLTVAEDQPCLLLDEVHIGERSVLLTGRAHDVTGGRGRLRGPRADTGTGALRVDAGRFRLEVPTWHVPWGDRPAAVPANVYTVSVVDGARRVPLLAGDLHGLARPAPRVHGWSVEVGADRRVGLRRSRHADRSIASRHGQRWLRSTAYDVALSRPPRDLVLLESFGGTGAGDGPRAVCDRLLETGTDLDLVWSVDDLAVPGVEGTRSVLRGSPAWYDAMGSARLLVNNNTFPPYVRKGPEQCYVQTWHGTPLKRIGTDIAHQRLSTEHYLRLLLREANTWDVLVSPSAYCTAIFRRAFAYDGEILEIGRPSNDLLLGASAGRIRESVRAAVGVPAGQTLMLYAPTWRDDASRGGTWDKALFLDAERVTATRPDVTVLVRGHPNTASRPRVTGERVLDVTAYPDVTRLYLAADLLVTDYSAAMFDFAVADKPTFLLTPDLDAYRDRVRGLYLDLEAVATGPVVRSTDALLERLDEDWSEARARLRATYAPHDDGAVTDRLLAAVGIGTGTVPAGLVASSGSR